jgi:hypothetical protein
MLQLQPDAYALHERTQGELYEGVVITASSLVLFVVFCIVLVCCVLWFVVFLVCLLC